MPPADRVLDVPVDWARMAAEASADTAEHHA
jgi:hypothetical protein